MSKFLRPLLRDIAADKIYPIYLVVGEEEWGKQKFLKALKKQLVEPGMEEFTLDQLSAGEITGVAVTDKSRDLPMMANRRLIIIDDCEKYNKADMTALAKYAEDPNDTTCLVLLFKAPNKRYKLFKMKSQAMCLLDFPKPKRWELNDFIADLARDMKLSLDKQTIELVAEKAGDDLAKVHQELEKLSLYKLGSSQITAQDVELLLGHTRQVTRWELNEYLGNRDLGGTLVKLHDILDSGEEPISLLSTVNMFLRQLMAAKLVMGKGVRDRQAVGQAIGVPPRIAQDLMAQQKNYSSYELRRAFGLMRDADFQLKSGHMNRKLFLDRLVTQILLPGPLSPPNRGGRR